jgi:hypothetical protein
VEGAWFNPAVEAFLSAYLAPYSILDAMYANSL